MDTLGKRLKQLRQTHFKMKQDLFSKVIGVSQGALSEIERGNRGLPIEALSSLMEYSKSDIAFSCEWLLTGNGEITPQKAMNDSFSILDMWQLKDYQKEALSQYLSMLTEEQAALINNYEKLTQHDKKEIRAIIKMKLSEYESNLSDSVEAAGL